MEQGTNFQEKIQAIKSMGNEQVVFDEDSIAKEYKHLDDSRTNLAVKILSIFGGIIASLAFMGFLFIAGFYNSETGLLLLGVTLLTGSILLNQKSKKTIIDTVSISAYIIGYIMLSFGMAELDLDENMISIILLVMGLASLFITQAYMLSFLAVLLINGCLLFLIFENKAYNLIHAYIAFSAGAITYWFLYEARLLSSNAIVSKLYYPVRIALVISYVVALSTIGAKNAMEIDISTVWFSSIFTIPMTIYVIISIAKTMGVNDKNKTWLYAGICTLVLLPTAFSPAISGALLVLLLSFKVNYKTAFVISIIAFIYFIGQYYYDLNFTLLTKSIILFSSGVLFLLLFVFINKKLKNNEI